MISLKYLFGSENTCELPPKEGSCYGYNKSVKRFYFDADEEICKSFTYSGCDGNANNFSSMKGCEDECGGQGKYE